MLLDPRTELEPMEYKAAYDFWLSHQESYWNHTKISLREDIIDFKEKMTDKQRNVIGNTLKSFTQTELVVGGEYWSSKPAKWFPKPEIVMMCLEFSAREMIHVIAYSQVDTNLNIKDYKGFLQEPAVKNKLDALLNLPTTTMKEKAASLALFSAFTEGVNLFSSFAILLNFSRFEMMKGLGALINYSILDEASHSEAGCWLFKTFVEEYNLWDADLKKVIYDAARLSIKLEDDFLDKVFEMGDIPGLSKYEMKSFIRTRANQKLNELGLKSNWRNVDVKAFESVDYWFSANSSGEKDNDTFVKRGTGIYAKGNKDWNTMWDGIDKDNILLFEGSLINEKT